MERRARIIELLTEGKYVHADRVLAALCTVPVNGIMKPGDTVTFIPSVRHLPFPGKVNRQANDHHPLERRALQ